MRAEIECARTAPAPPAATALFPSPFVLSQHVSQVRAARRTTLAAPHDRAQRAELENRLYTLRVLTGSCTAHAALTAAEAFWRRTGFRVRALPQLPLRSFEYCSVVRRPGLSR
ncbi:DUF5133 domain-containing protein [Streptomyces sp. NPDC059456]|uniref:DUF5133 domain-containing protein n=1 Tax=Streptomyces sp. NPDC059456 TaxID=3346838 RepID=UPI0036B1987B